MPAWFDYLRRLLGWWSAPVAEGAHSPNTWPALHGPNDSFVDLAGPASAFRDLNGPPSDFRELSGG
jgi:hypothetical protein